MEFTAKTIAEYLNGQIDGNPDATVHTISKIEEGVEGTLSFLANPKYAKYVYTTQASVILVNETFQPEKPINSTLIRVKDAYQAFASLLEFYQEHKSNRNKNIGIEEYAFIDDTVQLGNEVYVAAFAYIGNHVRIGNNVKIYPHVYLGDNVQIGDNTILYAGVKIYNECIVGANCIIHAGTVVGSDGFGFAAGQEQNFKKIPQIGNVIIEDHVEIGANTTIDRATMGHTIIHKGVKLDNLIQVGHNVEIGENTGIAAQTGISGSSKIGRECLIGGQVGLAGHLSIANEVKIGAQAGINTSVRKEGDIIQGTPAIPLRNFQRSSIVFKQLPELRHQIMQMSRDLEELKNKLGEMDK